LKRIIDIGGGSDHTFAIRKDASVFSWGANNHAQTGIVDARGEFDPMILWPTLVTSLEPYGDIRQITGGPHNSFAVTHDGGCLSWGRLYAFATGLDMNALSREGILRDDRGRPSILTVPTPIPEFKAASIAAGGDHVLAVTRNNKVYSWGFNLDGRTGQKDGKSDDCDDDIEMATLLDCPALKGKKLVWVGAGGQFSIIGAMP
jgi:regulator of chromosome condensation